MHRLRAHRGDDAGGAGRRRRAAGAPALRARAASACYCAYGFFEAVTLSFAPTRTNAAVPGPRTCRASRRGVANPVSRDEPRAAPQPDRRSARAPGAPTATRASKAWRAFTIGRVFWRTDAPHEGWRLAGLLAGELPHRGLGAPRAASSPTPRAPSRGCSSACTSPIACAGTRARSCRFTPARARALPCGDVRSVSSAQLHPEVAVRARSRRAVLVV